MNWADWLLIAILGLSTLLSLTRGFVRESLSLAVWAVAFFVALSFQERLAPLLGDFVSSPSLRMLLAYALLFIATLILGGLASRLLGELVKLAGLGHLDRVLGTAFGLARGVIIVMVLLIVLPELLPLKQEDWWQESALIPQFLLMEYWCRDTFSQLMGWVSGLFG